jgi:uncharacterized protein (TIGR02145 family)
MKRILSCLFASLFFFACSSGGSSEEQNQGVDSSSSEINDEAMSSSGPVISLPSSSSYVECSFTDSRDNQTYKCVEINGKTWMAENLDYTDENGEIGIASYGRLYAWDETEQICPANWHLPSKEEWEALITFAGGEEIAGKKLKAKEGWIGSETGTDDYGFTALPAGKKPEMQPWTCDAPPGAVCSAPYPDGNAGESGWWWTSTYPDAAVSPPEAYSVNMSSHRDNVSMKYYVQTYSMSVRCVRD